MGGVENRLRTAGLKGGGLRSGDLLSLNLFNVSRNILNKFGYAAKYEVDYRHYALIKIQEILQNFVSG